MSPAPRPDPSIVTDYAVEAIIGAREEQQDAARCEPFTSAGGQGGLLMVVADGMGGHAAGQLASRLAAEGFMNAFLTQRGAPTQDRLRDALDCANAAIGEAVRNNPALDGMGSTLVAAAISDRVIRWISVGDSLLLVGPRPLRRLNADHSLAGTLAEAVERGEMTAAEAAENPQRHMLRSALTGREIALVDEGEAPAPPGGVVVLATDGVFTLPDGRLAELCERYPSPGAFIAEVLGEISTDMPFDQDNTTLAAATLGGTAPRAAVAAVRRGVGLVVLGLSLAALAALVAVGLGLPSDLRPKAPGTSPPIPSEAPSPVAPDPKRPSAKAAPPDFVQVEPAPATPKPTKGSAGVNAAPKGSSQPSHGATPPARARNEGPAPAARPKPSVASPSGPAATTDRERRASPSTDTRPLEEAPPSPPPQVQSAPSAPAPSRVGPER